MPDWKPPFIEIGTIPQAVGKKPALLSCRCNLALEKLPNVPLCRRISESKSMQFTLKQIETFVWVATLGSFRRAAERLNTTQPNISSRISALESVLGVILMRRDAGSVQLTPKGDELLKVSQDLLRAAEQVTETAGSASLQSGVLKLGVTEMIVHSWLRRFMARFHRIYPNILVELTVDISVNLQEDLVSRSVDLAFLNSPADPGVMASLPLGNAPMIWVSAPDIGLASDTPVTTEHLAAFPILTSARNTKPFEDTTRHFRQYPEVKARVVPSSNLAASLQMTIDGLGIATLPQPMAQEALNAGDLIQLDYNWSPADLPFFACYDPAWHTKLLERAANLAADCAAPYGQPPNDKES